MSATDQPPGIFIDSEVDAEWSKCLHSDYRRGCAAQCSRNNSSKDHKDYIAPSITIPKTMTKGTSVTRENYEGSLIYDVPGVTLSLCVKKHNYEKYMWQFIHEGLLAGAKAYQNLYLWTVQLKVRINRRVSFGNLKRGLQNRFGLSPADTLKFCLDGFYGMPGCGDIFGNFGADVVPWMEVSRQSTADSLQLRDGDFIFVSYCNEKMESLARTRKRILMTLPMERGLSDTPSSLTLTPSDAKSESRPELVSYNALPMAGSTPLPGPNMAQELEQPPAATLSMSIHMNPMNVAIERVACSQFSMLVSNHCGELDSDPNCCARLSTVFTEDGAELVPDALNRLLRLQSELGDIFRVSYPNCCSGLSLAISPDLQRRLLDATDQSEVVFLQGLVKSRVFRFDSALSGAADRDSPGSGVVQELRRFAAELDIRLIAQCGDQPDAWRVVSADFFVVDTFFAAAVASVFGTGRDHRFQPYTVDSAMLSIDECFSYAAVNPGAPSEHHLTRAWDLLYSLHPTMRELTSLKPCRRLARLKDKLLRANESWKNFVGLSVCSLYDDYSAKKAAFWSINYLVVHKSVYDSLQSEIDAVLQQTRSVGGRLYSVNSFRRLTLKDIEEMRFLDAFVKEVMRHTCGQFLRFQASTGLILETENFAGLRCKRDSQIAVLVRALNMNPKYFNNPNAFCPQRFLSDSQGIEPPCLPFGISSVRHRVGLLKLKLFLIMLLSRCNLGRGHGPAAVVNSRVYGVDVLPYAEDVNFQYRRREQFRG